MRGAAIAIVIGALGARATAHPPPPPPPPEEIPHDRDKPIVDVGPWWAGPIMEHYAGWALGARVAAWIPSDSLQYGLEAEVGRVWLTTYREEPLDDAIAGVIARGGANVRWTFGRAKWDDLPIDFWVQAGAGVHVIQWTAGGRMVRPDGLIGFGVVEQFGTRRRIGMDAGVVMIFGRGSAAGMPTCAGPCDEPTPPVRGDVLVVDQTTLTVSW